MEDINKLKEEIYPAIERAEGLSVLENIRVAELGKRGRITNLLKTLGQLDQKERMVAGKIFNELKNSVFDQLVFFNFFFDNMPRIINISN